jgi:hypothetical protein
MKGPVTICVRCERDAPPVMRMQDRWLTLADDDEREYAMVCPDCQREDERHAVTEFLAAYGAPASIDGMAGDGE